MAEPGAKLARLWMTLGAVAATLGGWIALASADAQPPEPVAPELPALPTLEPTATLRVLPAPAARRPAPIAISRSSR